MEKRVELKDSARFLFAPPKSNGQDASVKRSKRACKFRQNSGSTPKNAPSRSAVSSEIARLPVIISRTCVAGTPKSSASRRSEIPAGFKNSSDKISPGETTSSRFIKPFFLLTIANRFNAYAVDASNKKTRRVLTLDAFLFAQPFRRSEIDVFFAASPGVPPRRWAKKSSDNGAKKTNSRGCAGKTALAGRANKKDAESCDSTSFSL